MTTEQGIGVLAVVTAVVLGAMWLGWARRGARTASLVPALPAVPGPGDRGEALGTVEATYVSTTLAGSWLERVVAHRLGVRSSAVVSVHPAGVMIARQGAPDLFVPADSLRGAHLAPGIAGKVVGGERLVVLRWAIGGVEVDTGFLPRRQADRGVVMAALAGLVPGVEGTPTSEEPQ